MKTAKKEKQKKVQKTISRNPRKEQWRPTLFVAAVVRPRSQLKSNPISRGAGMLSGKPIK